MVKATGRAAGGVSDIRELRIQHGWTRKELRHRFNTLAADRKILDSDGWPVEIAESTLASWENGHRVPKIKHARVLALVFGLPPSTVIQRLRQCVKR